MDPGQASRREVSGVASPAPPPFVRVAPSLFLGAARTAAAPELLARAGVTLCVNVSRQQPGPCTPGVAELRVPVFDDPAEDLLAHLEPTCAAMEAAVRAGGACLVYCKNGRSRSAAVCTAYLMRHRGLSLARAFQLQKYEEALQSLPCLSGEPSGPCSGTRGDELQNEP
ncbi:dual specificity phosphatase 28 isoform X2 [Callorhinus ursinus]|uniref:Dual specificity phosphatase 28 n=1 Tax=Callorhinus ursinus TaxID=34884 RepID=A0A3Q7QF75_CALUR|nr:dual specificity phosphatase 28 isoform X2 [Callorhinus ursinus]